MMADVIQLVTQTETLDAWGDRTITENFREVFCTVSSIGMKEFYQADAAGLKPEIRFTLTDARDYQSEYIVIHEGTRYRVLRTYERDNVLELTCYREVNPYGNAS